MKNPKKITSLAELQVEKKRLASVAEKNKALLQEDLAEMKSAVAPEELLNKAATSMVPEALRHSTLINGPVNFLARTFFHDGNVVSNRSDSGRGNHIRNIILGLAEAIAAWLLTRFLRRRF